METKIKICGMKFQENIEEIASLKPDFIGFIFYKKSPRFFESEIPAINQSIKKVGVFVNASLEEIQEKLIQYQLDFIQLHGDESPEFCYLVHQKNIKVIKAFSVDNDFNFNILTNYYNHCNYFLFDTKGVSYGGNGTVFDWSVLENYNLDKPYFLSGGIGTDNLEDVKRFLSRKQSNNCFAIDCNSKLEITPGLKSAEKVKQLVHAFQI